ncbi:MAG: S41 family peptidase, partial [Butyrivibrio sp.]|nr:S41 family peptidase [Butyrivibrio sp.]
MEEYSNGVQYNTAAGGGNPAPVPPQQSEPPQPGQPQDVPPVVAPRGILLGGICIGIILTLVAGGLGYSMVRIRGRQQELAEMAGQQQTQQGTILNAEAQARINALEQSIRSYYYKTEVDEEKARIGMYRGLVDSLEDPYSVYYTAEEYQDLMSDTEGIYCGIGAYVTIDNDLKYPRITGIIKNSPAEEAELRAEDIIYEVEGESTYGMELSVVVSKIKGEEGTNVHLTILREGDGELGFDLTRRKVETPTVETEMKEDGIGYLALSAFDLVSTDQFIQGMADLRAQGMKGLVLDLRSNPGGNLSVVCDIARQLLPEGLIVYTEDRDGNRSDYSCDGTNQIDIPMVVLVNGYSASASEILAGAIQDYGIGTIVGTTTYGKGVVQRVYNFDDGSAVKLTISSYFTPNGKNINGVGI